MKIIKNKIIPFPGYSAINLFGVIFTRDNEKLSERTLNHESIHTAQMKEMGYVFFYIVYFIEWIIRSIQEKSFGNKSYHKISFEEEAYCNDKDMNYLENRKPYAWLKWW